MNKIRYGGPLHTLVFGPNGKGKGTRILMPNLLQMSGSSIVVVDPKGELAAVTAPFRRQLGRVVIINPFGVFTDISGYEDLRSVGFNPLTSLDPDSPSFNADAGLLGDALIKCDPRESEHWGGSARALLAALIMFTVMEAKGKTPVWEIPGKPAPSRVPTMRRVRQLLCQASVAPNASNNFEGAGLPALALRLIDSQLDGLANKASQFTDWNKEIQSIASTAKRQTECFDDTEIANDLATDGFNFKELRRAPITVYIVLPPDKLDRHAQWLRLVLTAAIQGVLRVRKQGEPKTLFMLDEFFALGHLQIISTVWALVRGYGIQIMPILQDLGQLKKLYPDMWETFVGMTGAIASFAPNDETTSEWLSRRCGDTTRKALNKNSTTTSNKGGSSGSTSNFGANSSGSSSSFGSNWGSSTSYSLTANPVKVPLITAHQLRGLHTGYMVLALNGLSNVIPTYAPAYYQILQCQERARNNPYYSG
jgi:type IV secretion system protein VirD4